MLQTRCTFFLRDGSITRKLTLSPKIRAVSGMTMPALRSLIEKIHIPISCEYADKAPTNSNTTLTNMPVTCDYANKSTSETPLSGTESVGQWDQGWRVTESSSTLPRILTENMDRRQKTRKPLTDVFRDCEKLWAEEANLQAEGGDVAAMLLYGEMLSVGYGVKRSTPMARWWWTRAKSAGSDVAAKRLKEVDKLAC